MLRDIRERYLGRRIDVYWHGFLQADEARLALFRAEKGTPDFEIAGETFYRPVPPRLKRLYRLKLWPWIQRSLIHSLAQDSVRDAQVFTQYEAIFLAGGDQWNGMDLGVSMFASLLAIGRVNEEIYQYPFSLNPAVLNFNTCADLRRYFGTIQAPIIVRDSITHDVMTRIGIRTAIGNDVVFSLSEIGQKISPAADRDAERILLVLTGADNRVLLRDALSRLLKQLQGCGRTIDFLTTCWTEDLQIYSELGNRFNVTVHAPMTWQETVAELKQSAVVVTDRLHCSILGTFAECTLFPVGDRKKVEAFIRDSGAPHHAQTIEGVTPAALEAAISDRTAVRDTLRTYRDAAASRKITPIRQLVSA